jgi:hypothetical protein
VVPPVAAPAILLAALLLAAARGDVDTLAVDRAPSLSRASPEATLWFGGDVQLGAGGRGVLEPIRAWVGEARGVVHLAGPILASEPRTRGPRLYTTPEALAELATAGVRVVALANEHARDGGPERVQRAARLLRETNVMSAGPGAGVATLSLHGMRVAIVAHDLSRGLPQDLGPSLREARRGSEVLVVYFHVTGPDDYRPRPELVAAADSAHAAGASVIVATGTHAIGPVERRGGAVIAWGLGDLAYEYPSAAKREAILLRVAVGIDSARTAEVIPIRAASRDEPVRLADQPGALFDLLEAFGGTPLRREGDRAWF